MLEKGALMTMWIRTWQAPPWPLWKQAWESTILNPHRTQSSSHLSRLITVVVTSWRALGSSLPGNGGFSTRTVCPMGLLPDTQNWGCACAGYAGNVFPATAVLRSRHTSRHVRDARAVMHAGVANYWFTLKSMAGKTFPAFPAHAQPAILRIW